MSARSSLTLSIFFGVACFHFPTLKSQCVNQTQILCYCCSEETRANPQDEIRNVFAMFIKQPKSNYKFWYAAVFFFNFQSSGAIFTRYHERFTCKHRTGEGKLLFRENANSPRVNKTMMYSISTQCTNKTATHMNVCISLCSFASLTFNKAWAILLFFYLTYQHD